MISATVSNVPRALLVVLCLYVIAGFAFAFNAPFLEVSDEVRHYALVEHLASGNGLPVQDPERHAAITREERAALRPLTYYAQEGSQPPLYYALMALLVQPFDRGDFAARALPNPHAQLGRADTTSNWNQLVHLPSEAFPWRGVVLAVQVLRAIGIAFGAVAVLGAYALARAAGLGQSTALLAASLVAFNPMFVHIMASVNNDTLTAALSTLTLLVAAQALRAETFDARTALLLGVLGGAAALSKASGLAVALVAPLFVALRGFALSKRGAALRFALSAWASAALVAGWWYGRNAVLYGDFTGTAMMARIAGAREQPPSLLALAGEWEGFYMAFWGLFGAVNIPMHALIYDVLEGVLVAAGLGLLLAVGQQVRSKRGARAWLQPDVLVLAMLSAAVFITFAALVRWTSLTLASQGRLMFPVIAAIAVLVAHGLSTLAGTLCARLWRGMVPGWAQHGWLAIAAPLAVLTLLAPFVYVRPAYALPAILPDESAIPQANFTRTELFFEGGVRWIGFQVHTPRARVQPGDVLDVTLYWQATQPITRNLSAFVRLYARDEVEVFVLDTYPGGGMYPTTFWQPGTVIADRYRLRLAATPTLTQRLPTTLWLDVGFWDFTRQVFMATFDGQGRPTGRQRYEAASAALQPAPVSRAAVARFAQADVLDARLSHAPGEVLLELDWRATADFTEDYTTFVQLFTASGEKLPPQGDARALAGGFAPRWWRAGDLILGDRYVLALDAPLPPGAYEVRFGLYRADGARMPVTDAGALGGGADYLALPFVVSP